MMRTNEVDLLEVMNTLNVPEEVLGILVEEGKLKPRHADGTTCFSREEIDGLIALIGRKSMRQNEVNLLEAADLLDVPEEALVKLAGCFLRRLVTNESP